MGDKNTEQELAEELFNLVMSGDPLYRGGAEISTCRKAAKLWRSQMLGRELTQEEVAAIELHFEIKQVKSE